MRIEWIRCADSSMNICDITEAVSSVSCGGSVSQAARLAEITVVNAPNDKNVKILNIEAGNIIRLYESDSLIFFGEVQSSKRTSETGTVAYSCYDLLNHLLKSTGIYNFSNTTAERITAKICADMKISTGSIAETKAPIKKMIIDGDTLYDIIMKAYTKAAEQTGEKYICRMIGSELSVEVKGTIVKNFVLAEEHNITNTEYEETIENMVNVVKIYDEKGTQVGEVKNDEWAEKYGIYQQTYKKEKGINEITAANSMLQGVEKRVTLDGIDGDLTCIAGNAVEVYDKATGLNGIFWIDSDTHIWENGTHIMNLELNFKNIMDSREYEETEE
ncbi:MAG: hypothetical protein J6C33_06135 [Lachnospiraceae bacterium]|nr:hypothetical protein [Lachnospiraceae bacterium]